jgi:hypothetical protein
VDAYAHAALEPSGDVTSSVAAPRSILLGPNVIREDGHAIYGGAAEREGGARSVLWATDRRQWKYGTRGGAAQRTGRSVSARSQGAGGDALCRLSLFIRASRQVPKTLQYDRRESPPCVASVSMARSIGSMSSGLLCSRRAVQRVS